MEFLQQTIKLISQEQLLKLKQKASEINRNLFELNVGQKVQGFWTKDKGLLEMSLTHLP